MKTRWLVGFSVLVVMVLGTSLGWAEQPRYGGTLRIAWPGDPAFFAANQGPAQGAPAAWLVHQWRRALEPEKRKAISAAMQRRLADQLEWVNITTYPYFEAYRQSVKNFPFYNQAYQFFDTTWLEQ